jgi:thiopeptide-type bacteriocin biosynthesis protein
VVGRLVLDTYYPETGRYGHGPALEAAEEVFVADSRLVAAQLRSLPERVMSRDALVAVNLVATASGFLGGTEPAMRWLMSRPSPAAPPADRAVLDQIVALTGDGELRGLASWGGEVADTWHARADALASYRSRLPADADPSSILESLLHMHCNRAVGVDRDREASCRRLARHAALAWTARHGPTDDRG